MKPRLSQGPASILGALAAAIVIAGCADLNVPQLRPVKQVLVDPDTAVLRVGDSILIKAAPVDSVATLESQQTITWTSTAQAVASVSATGLVHGVSAGTATISAAVGSIAGHIFVIVTGAPSTEVISAGNNETASVNTALLVSPTVLVTDAGGNPVPRATVTFAVTAGGGSLTPSTPVRTGLDGKASASWTLGPSKGTNSMTATVTDSGISITPATFTAVATVGAPSATLSAIDVAPASIPPSNGTVFSTITVTVKDSTGATISGQTVTFSSTGTGNTLSQPTDTTDATGRTSGALSSSVAEAKVITATVNGTVVLIQKDTVNVSNAAATQIGVSTHTVAVANHAFSTPPAVDIRDGFGNRVSTATNPVTVTLISGNGTLSGSPTTVNAVAGRATFSGLLITGARATDTLGAGTQILRFSSPGFTSVTDTVQVGVSFSYNIADIFQRNCNSCHGFTYANTVNAGTSFSCTGNTRIVASDTSNSYIYTKIKSTSPPCGGGMPTSGQMSLTQIQLIRDWIVQGAPNN